MRKYLITKEGSYYKANLHCHSTVSDGRMTPNQLKEAYKSQGYSVLAYTDHNVLVDHSDLCDSDFLALKGYEMEINKSGEGNDKRFKTCHIVLISKNENNRKMVCFNPELVWGNARDFLDIVEYEKNEPPYERVYSPECINDIVRRAKQGGFYTIYAHPTWSCQRYNDYIKYENFDAMEMYNHGCVVEGNNDINDHVYEDFLYDGKMLACVATDDNHNAFLTDSSMANDSFGGYTMIKAPSLSYSDIVHSLETNNFYCSTGPEIKELFWDNNRVCVQSSEAEMICYLGSTRWAQRVNRNVADKLTMATFVPNGKDEWFRIKVIDKDGNAAYSNAYYLADLRK